jgi:hypothetical protein
MILEITRPRHLTRASMTEMPNLANQVSIYIHGVPISLSSYATNSKMYEGKEGVFNRRERLLSRFTTDELYITCDHCDNFLCLSGCCPDSKNVPCYHYLSFSLTALALQMDPVAQQQK